VRGEKQKKKKRHPDCIILCVRPDHPCTGSYRTQLVNAGKLATGHSSFIVFLTKSVKEFRTPERSWEIYFVPYSKSVDYTTVCFFRTSHDILSVSAVVQCMTNLGHVIVFYRYLLVYTHSLGVATQYDVAVLNAFCPSDVGLVRFRPKFSGKISLPLSSILSIQHAK